MKKQLIPAILLTLLCGVLAANAGAVTLAEFTRHQIYVSLDVPSHTVAVKDQGRVCVDKGWNLFYVNERAALDSLLVGGNSVQRLVISPRDTAQLPPAIRGSLPREEIPRGCKLVFFNAKRADTVDFVLVFKCVYDQDVKDVRFSRETVGAEVTGTILDRGAYLSAAGLYYPQGAEKAVQFGLTADIPAAWSSIADGNRLKVEPRGDRKIESWQNPYMSDGCTFMAAPYLPKTLMVDSIEVACYFFESDTSLADSYLKASAGYIKMYSDLIGPYPYRRFTVAENFFPTGYGMPAWTLLGQTVLRLPFIISSSLGHEVLHNWWGNSVYVNYDKGNWCEGATVYGADYRYKLAESPASAEQYRKDLLKEYQNYVGQDKDFPLRDFKSRTSPSTRAIGYNKSMMVFHMIELEIGTSAFFDAWKRVYQEYLGKQISWDEWIGVFQAVSKKDLSFIIPQWIDRTGAPTIGMRIAGAETSADGRSKVIHVKLSEQSTPPYRLRVPLRAEGPGIRIDTFAILSGPELAFDWELPAGVVTVSADPDYDLFRTLYPEEIEPVVSATLGAPQKQLVSFAAGDSLASAFKTFGASLLEDSLAVLDGSKASLNDSAAAVVLNATDFVEPLDGQVVIGPDSVLVAGTSYSRKGHTFAFALRSWHGCDKSLAILSDDPASLPRLGELIPHYGKYSYLMFEGARNVAKGQWESGKSPLKVAIGAK